jgi:hypothetical protein
METRFWSFVSPEPNSGCWLWTGTGYSGPRQYGRFSIDGTCTQAHRAAWLIYRGPIPDGVVVCHRCDVAPCVNPDHLFLGTHQDNMRDMVAKGRSDGIRRANRGQGCHFSKFSPEQVLRIRADRRPQRVIAQEYSVRPSSISRIKSGLHWKHLP